MSDMRDMRGYRHVGSRDGLEEEWLDTRRPQVSPGKVSLTSRLQGPAPAARAAASPEGAAVQRKALSETDVAARQEEMTRWEDAALLGLGPESNAQANGDTVAHAGRDGAVQMRAAEAQESPEVPVRLPGGGGGAEMPEDVRAKMEGAFGADFSSVRIHEGPQAEEVGALAYTQGTDIHFAPGQYQPQSQRGQELLGHELTHVVQQSQGRVQATTQAKGVDINDDASLEREADEIGTRAARWEGVNVPHEAIGIPPDGSVMKQTVQDSASKTSTVADVGLAHLVQQRHDGTSVPAQKSKKVNTDPKSPKSSSSGRESAAQAKRDTVAHPAAQLADERVAKLDDNYKEAITGCRWRDAAYYLNEFNPDDIRTRLSQLTQMDHAELRRAAVHDDRVGNDSGVVKKIDEVSGRESQRIGDLLDNYEAAIQNGRWPDAAYYLNAFSPDDIKVRLRPLDRTQRAELRRGAARHSDVGLGAGVVVTIDKYDSDAKGVAELINMYEAAVRDGKWKEAAKHLNAFNPDDIRMLLSRLSDDDVLNIQKGAVENPILGGGQAVVKEIAAVLGRTAPQIRSRAEWGAASPILNDPERSYEKYTSDINDILDSIVVHHSGNSNMHTMKEVQNKAQKKQKRADVAYHFGIDLEGNIYEGRPIDVKGAHVKGANTGKIGIVLLADLDEQEWDFDDELTTKMEASLLRMLSHLRGKYPKIEFLGGHTEFAAATGDERNCPGNLVMANIDSWRSMTGLKKPNKSP